VLISCLFLLVFGACSEFARGEFIEPVEGACPELVEGIFGSSDEAIDSNGGN